MDFGEHQRSVHSVFTNTSQVAEPFGKVLYELYKWHHAFSKSQSGHYGQLTKVMPDFLCQIPL